VYGTGDTVFHLHVQTRDGVLIINAGIFQITLSSRLNHVADHNTLNRFVFWGASAAVGTTNVLHMTTVLTVLASITSFFCHGERRVAIPSVKLG